ncbi:MAG: Fur family transcriptional regulator [Atopobiaceae bacterium]|jgi:Fur family ferric uptake transcriptional regulator
MSNKVYSTEQRRLVMAYLKETTDRYQTVDQILEGMHRQDLNVGRTTIYRMLERLVQEGVVAKVTAVQSHSACYRLLDSTAESTGQLLCLHCGRVLPLECHMIQEFADHVSQHHGFEIDQAKTVIFGICEDCQRAGEVPEGNYHATHASAHVAPQEGNVAGDAHQDSAENSHT